MISLVISPRVIIPSGRGMMPSSDFPGKYLKEFLDINACWNPRIFPGDPALAFRESSSFPMRNFQRSEHSG